MILTPQQQHYRRNNMFSVTSIHLGGENLFELLTVHLVDNIKNFEKD